MPLSIVVELVAELFGSLIVEGAVLGARTAAAATSEALEERRRRRVERALACADLVVLAAHHDFVVTEAERAVLAEACGEALAKVDVEVTVEALIDRWGAEIRDIAEPAAFEGRVRELGALLETRDARWVLRSVERLVAADARPAGGLRAPAATGGPDTLALFRALLGPG